MDIIISDKRANIVLDATVLSTVMSCGRLADLRFNHHFQSLEGKSSSLGMGSIVHSYLENYYGQITHGMNRKDAHGYGLTAANAYAMSEEATNVEVDDKVFALETCEVYNDYYKNDPWIPLEVETIKSKLIYTDDEIRVIWKAKLDLIADTSSGIMPIDHKTMKQRRDSTSLNNQFSGQAMLMGTRSVIVNKIGFQKSLKPSERFSRPHVPYSADRLNEWASTIVPYWAKMMLMYQESGYWPPNFTHCENKFGFCNFRNVCEADRNMREDVIGMSFKVGEPWNMGVPKKNEEAS